MLGVYISYSIPCTHVATVHATHEYTAENFTIELTVDKEINFWKYSYALNL